MSRYYAVRLLEFHTGMIFDSYREASKFIGNKLNYTRGFNTIVDAEKWLKTQNMATDKERIKEIHSIKYETYRIK